MRRIHHFLMALAVPVSLATPAAADITTLKNTFRSSCFETLPNLPSDHLGAAFAGDPWTYIPGADYGEFEMHFETTSVFMSPNSCSVMDSAASLEETRLMLEAQLADVFPKQWSRETDDDGAPMWRLNIDNATVNFYILEGHGGGAAVSLGVRR